MSIQIQDIDELKRIATNTYDRDKSFVMRVIQGIAKLERDNAALSKENELLKEQLKSKN